MQYRKIKELKKLANNPRKITAKQLQTLCDSIQGSPKYFEARPLILSDRTGDLVIIAGNQRYEAAKKLKLSEVPTFLLEGLTEEKEREIVIRDNVSNGEFDWEIMEAEWGSLPLEDWGVKLPSGWQEDNNTYTQKIETPAYRPKKDSPPPIKALYNEARRGGLSDAAKSDTGLTQEEREFLELAATRHIVFNYAEIAEYYCHATKAMQRHMEDSALVIIDYERAIELGYVKLYETILEQYEAEHGNEQ